MRRFSPKRCVAVFISGFFIRDDNNEKTAFCKNLPKIDATVKEMVAKLGNVLRMIVVSLLPHTEFGPNEHPEGAPYFK